MLRHVDGQRKVLRLPVAQAGLGAGTKGQLSTSGSQAYSVDIQSDVAGFTHTQRRRQEALCGRADVSRRVNALRPEVGPVCAFPRGDFSRIPYLFKRWGMGGV